MSILESPACPMCGSVNHVRVYALPPFGVVRCTRCGMHFLSPRLPEPEMLRAYASGDYFENAEIGYDSYAEQEVSLRATFRRVSRQLVRDGYAGGDLLEIGAGYGFLLEEVKHQFRSVLGTEFSQEAASSARTRGIDVRVGGLEALPVEPAFDCIIATHVVEHVYDPRSFTRDVASRLRPGGHLVLGTPDMGSFWRRAMKRRWPSFKVPEHVLYFDRKALTALMLDAGLEDVRNFAYPHAFPLSLVLSKLGVRAASHRLGRIGAMPITLPATTLALAGRRPTTTG